MTKAEAEKIMATPEYINSGRVAVYVYQDGDDYVVTVRGEEIRASNPFGLDSQLDRFFGKRNLFLVSKEEAENE